MSSRGAPFTRFKLGRWPGFRAELARQALRSGIAQANIVRDALRAAGIADFPHGKGGPVALAARYGDQGYVSLKVEELAQLRARFESSEAMRHAIISALVSYMGFPYDPAAQVRAVDRMTQAQVRKAAASAGSSPDVPRWPRGYKLRVGHLTGRPYLARTA